MTQMRIKQIIPISDQVEGATAAMAQQPKTRAIGQRYDLDSLAFVGAVENRLGDLQADGGIEG
ncbi:hypothetical protein ACYZTL_22495 [Pseudomonas sp. LB3P81]